MTEHAELDIPAPQVLEDGKRKRMGVSGWGNVRLDPSATVGQASNSGVSAIVLTTFSAELNIDPRSRPCQFNDSAQSIDNGSSPLMSPDTFRHLPFLLLITMFLTLYL